MIVVTAAEMKALDEETIRGIGVPGVVLMENAGRAVVELVASLRSSLAATSVAVVAGPGANGGDGFVVARHLHERGAAVSVFLVGDAAKIGGDARVHFEAMRRSGIGIFDWSAGAAIDGAQRDLLLACDVVVDALLGTGAARPVEGRFREVIEIMNRARGVRVAVDLPSGLDVDRGHPNPVCVRADHTVTFAFAKLGLVTAPGYLYAGALRVADIGIPARLVRAPRAELLDEEVLRAIAAPRPPLSHKGSFGHVLCVAGSTRHPGAALLASSAAARAGAGLVTLATPDAVAAALAGAVREVSLAPLGAVSPGGELDDAEAAWRALEPQLAGKRALAFGCGLGRSPAVRALLARLLAAWEGPMVVDADGLNVLAEDLAPLDGSRARVVLTPHPMEMSRLAGIPTAEVQQDRVGVARAFAERHRAVVVLKGARTVVAAPDGRVALNPTGNPGMASGGTGDALTGVVAALAASGLAPFDAACAGCYLHGRAGDLAREARGEAGLLASDLIEMLPAARTRPAA
jgi:NAD(P)H-hydrate epimerase